jgi:hypothetical protein
VRKTYVYALDVILPEEPDLSGRDYPATSFRWPRNRKFLSESAAHRRAKLLRGYGARVVVIRSAPIEFPQAARMRQEITEKTLAELRAIEQDLR